MDTEDSVQARLQCLGYGISREMVANIEVGLRGVEDNWLVAFQKVFRLPIIQFFPQEILDLDADYAQNVLPNSQSPILLSTKKRRLNAQS